MSEKKSSIYQILQTEAIAGTLVNSDVAFFRKVCRWYSKEFNTPLHLVMEGKIIQWDEVLLHYYEDQMEDLPFNSIYDIACQDFIPELADQYEKENEEYAQALLEEQQRTIEAKKKRDAKKKQLKQPKKEEKQEPEQIDQPKPPEMNLRFDDEE